MNDKRTIRRTVKETVIEDRAYKDALINCFLYDSIITQSADEILLFSGFGQEPDLTPFAKNALMDGKKIAFPVTISKTEMIFRYVSDLDRDFCKGSFGTSEPKDKNNEVLFGTDSSKIIVCPGMAFGSDRTRLGHGNGYYDKFLAKYGNEFASVVGVAYSDFIFDNIPSEEHDYKMDYILTEQGWFR